MIKSQTNRDVDMSEEESRWKTRMLNLTGGISLSKHGVSAHQMSTTTPPAAAADAPCW